MKAAGSGSKYLVAGFWISTALFALQMSFTAYAQLQLPQVAGAFAHLGFPAYFRVELSWAKLAGVAALLVPMAPARIKEWAYAGFAITLVSALIAHLVVGEGVESWGWAAGPVCSGACHTSSGATYRRYLHCCRTRRRLHLLRLQATLNEAKSCARFAVAQEKERTNGISVGVHRREDQ